MTTAPLTTREFADRIHRYTPRAWVTPALIAMNAAVYVGMVLTGSSPLSPTTASLLKWGANLAPLSLGPQPVRLLTCMFVHIGLLHIAMNMYVLWDIGRFVEKLLGNAGMLIVYLLAGLTGSLASALLHPDTVSAGASGAIFGLYGALFGYLLRNRHEVPAEVLRNLRKVAGLFIIYNLLFGFAVKGIDLSAHLGGLVGGLVLGFAVAGPLTDAAVARRPWRNLLTAGGGLAILGAVLKATPPPANLAAEVQHVAALEQTLDADYHTAETQMNEHRLSAAAFAAQIRAQLQPPWEAAITHLAALKFSGREDAVRAQLLAYMRARDQLLDLTARELANPDIDGMAALRAKTAECDQLSRALTDSLAKPPE